MESIKQWYFRWKLRRVVAVLAHRTNAPKEHAAGVHAFAKMLEASEIMTRSVKKHEQVPMQCTRAELDSFIRYMTTLHDSRLSLLIRARVGLATLAMTDEEVLGESPKDVVKSEHGRRLAKSDSRFVDAEGKSLKVKT